MFIQILSLRASKMVQWIETLTVKPDYLSKIPGTHKKGENLLHKVVPYRLHMHSSSHIYTQKH